MRATLTGTAAPRWSCRRLGGPKAPGLDRYFPSWRTEIDVWDEASHCLRHKAAHDGAIPELVASLAEPPEAKMSYLGQLFPVSTVSRGGRLNVVLPSRTGLGMVTLDGSLVEEIPAPAPLEELCATPQ